jgi:hypothetical protein
LGSTIKALARATRCFSPPKALFKVRKVYYFKQSIESFFCLCLVDPVKVQAICDIFQNCEMGEESIILVDNADAPFFRRQSGDVLFSNENLATLYGNQTCYGFQKYCLACPGRTHENEKFILLYAQIGFLP